nr:DsrE family protein [Ramlibacter agri]
MVWSCGPGDAERAATPFVVAQAAAALDLEVEMLFTARSVHWLLAAQQGTKLGFGSEQLPVRDYLQACADAGVRILACSQALAARGLGRDALASQCAGLGGTVAFVERTQDPRWRALVF